MVLEAGEGGGGVTEPGKSGRKKREGLRPKWREY